MFLIFYFQIVDPNICQKTMNINSMCKDTRQSKSGNATKSKTCTKGIFHIRREFSKGYTNVAKLQYQIYKKEKKYMSV